MPEDLSSGPGQEHALEEARLLAALGVDPARGLDAAAVRDRLAEHGPNEIEAGRYPGWAAILASQFRGAIVWLLAAAAALSLAMGDAAEATAIGVVLVLNGAIGFAIELRATRSMQALRALTRTTARVRRDGAEAVVDAGALVPGDIVRLEAGALVPADLRLITANDLQADESTLTGESVPVAKRTGALAADAQLAERANMAWRGTSVTRGVGTGVVVRTGAASQIGAIAGMVAAAGERRSPLERRLEAMGRQLAWVALAAVAALAAIGLLGGRDPWEMLRTAVALAVAAVPEGLPIVATLALARGMWRMARRDVLVNRLTAIETLGSVDLILTDKTGTLTENHMAVAAFLLPGGQVPAEAVAARVAVDPALADAVRVAALCTDAEPASGDPMERALLAAAEAAGMPRAKLLEAAPLVGMRPFDPETKLMATVHRGPDGGFAAVKGAPEQVLAQARRIRTGHGAVALDAVARRRLLAEAEAAAGRGLRLLGLARGSIAGDDADPFGALVFLGFVALRDPPRGDVGAAIAACRQAGLRIVMVTGDHPATAHRIAAETGLVAADADPACVAQPDRAGGLAAADHAAIAGSPILARVAPRTKLDIVALHQRAGSVVAMIGDGVNDAPALRQADIGIAMGRRGTQVAVEASDIVLRDDSFASIVAAIREGRVIYGNIRQFIRYLFACNLSEVLVVAAALLAGLPMPLAPLQLLFLNLVTDVFPALALTAGEGPQDVMRRPPRPASEPLLGRRGWLGIGREATVIAGCTLLVFAAAVAWPENLGLAPTTGAFLTLALAQLWHVFMIRAPGEAWRDNQVVRNLWVWGALALSLGLIVAGALMPSLRTALDLVPPTPVGWAAVLAGSLAALALNAVLWRGRGDRI